MEARAGGRGGVLLSSQGVCTLLGRMLLVRVLGWCRAVWRGSWVGHGDIRMGRDGARQGGVCRRLKPGGRVMDGRGVVGCLVCAAAGAASAAGAAKDGVVKMVPAKVAYHDGSHAARARRAERQAWRMTQEGRGRRRGGSARKRDGGGEGGVDGGGGRGGGVAVGPGCGHLRPGGGAAGGARREADQRRATSGRPRSCLPWSK